MVWIVTSAPASNLLECTKKLELVNLSSNLGKFKCVPDREKIELFQNLR